MGTFSKSAIVAGLLLIAWTATGSAEWSPQDDPPTYEQYGSQDPHWVMDEASECWAYNAHGGANDSITWSGDCRDGKVSGPGTLTFFDQGRMFERVTGEFSEGILQNGHVSIAWNDGSKYDGDEQNGQFNGYGTLIASDGTRYQGLWKDDKFEGGRGNDSGPDPKPAARGDSGSSGQRTAQSTAGATEEKPASGKKDQKIYPVQWTLLGKALGNKLVAADGSRLLLERTGSGDLRQTIVHPEGASLSFVLLPLSDRLGTVQDSSNKVIATFRLRDGALTIAFGDGRTETIAPRASGGVKTTLLRASAPSLTTNWYLEGHRFSRAERDSSARQPPSRLALVLAATNSKKDPPVPLRDPAAVLPAKEPALAVNLRHSQTIAARTSRALPVPMTKPSEFAEPQRKPQRAALRRLLAETREVGTSPGPALSSQPQPAATEHASSPIQTELQRRLTRDLRRLPQRNSVKIAAVIRAPDPGPELLPQQPRHMSLPSATRQKRRLASAKPKSGERHDASGSTPPIPIEAAAQSKSLAPSPAIAVQPHIAVLFKPRQEERPEGVATSTQAAVLPQSARTQVPSIKTSTAAREPALASKPPPEIKHDAPVAPLKLPATIHTQLPPIQAPVVATIVVPQQHPASAPKRPPEEHHDTLAAAAPLFPPSPSTSIRPQVSASAPASPVSQQHLAVVRPLEEQQRESIPAPAPPAASPVQTATVPMPLAPANVMAPPQLAQTSRHASDDKRDTLTAVAAPTSPPPPVQATVSDSLTAPASLIHTLGPPVVPRRSASNCLTVESDGMHWGFRNHCPADIQFSYCLLNSADRLTACSSGAVGGSVAGNGFSALVADSSIKNPAASRAFRWVGCVGGAGEVSPRLDRIDPPMGRCLHSGDVRQGVERADVALHRR
jgi:hypothetical protein